MFEIDRFRTPLYSVAEAARYLGVPGSTFSAWGRGQVRAGEAGSAGGVVTFVEGGAAGRAATVPFVGLVEGLVLAAIRRAGVPLQRIRPALAHLEKEFGIEHALASQRLYTDGAEVLYDFGKGTENTREGRGALELVVVRHGQRVFAEAIVAYLRRVDFAEDGYARLVRLPQYETAEVVVDPYRGFGQPIFARGGARLENVLAMFKAGESLEVVSEEFGVPVGELEDALRVALPSAA